MLHHRFIRSTLGVFATLALSTGFMACIVGDSDPGTEESEDLGVSRDDLYASGHKIWHTLNIPVCWDNPGSASATARGWVQTAVANTWSAVSDVTFTGWGQCAWGASGIHIRISDEGPHTIALGRYLDGTVGGMVLNFDYKNWS